MTTIEKAVKDLRDAFNQPDYTELLNRIITLEKKVENLENEASANRQAIWNRVYDEMNI